MQLPDIRLPAADPIPEGIRPGGKITFITHLFPPGPGGMQRWNLQMAESYARSGFDVTVVHFCKRIVPFNPQGYTYIPLCIDPATNPATSSHFKYRFSVLARFARQFVSILPKLLRRRGIWQVSFGEPILLKILVFATSLLVPSKIVTAVGCRTFMHPYRTSLGRLIKRTLSSFMYARSTIMLVDGRDIERELCSFGVTGSRIKVCYAGVDTLLFFPREKMEAAQHIATKYGVKHTTSPVVVYCCRLSPENAPLDFIEALRRVPNVSGIVAGDGPLRTETQKAAGSIKERVIFTGSMEYEELPLVLSYADVCLFTYSRHIGGISQMVPLAMSCGAVVVTTDVGDMRALVAHGRNAFLVSPGNVDQMAQAITTIVADPALQLRIRTEAYNSIREHWALAQRDNLYRLLLIEAMGKL